MEGEVRELIENINIMKEDLSKYTKKVYERHLLKELKGLDKACTVNFNDPYQLRDVPEVSQEIPDGNALKNEMKSLTHRLHMQLKLLQILQIKKQCAVTQVLEEI